MGKLAAPRSHQSSFLCRKKIKDSLAAGRAQNPLAVLSYNPGILRHQGTGLHPRAAASLLLIRRSRQKRQERRGKKQGMDEPAFLNKTKCFAMFEMPTPKRTPVAPAGLSSPRMYDNLPSPLDVYHDVLSRN